MDYRQHDLACNRAIESEPHREADGGGDRYQHQIVADIVETGECDIAEQLVGLRRVDGVHAPDQLGNVLEDEEHRVGYQQQNHFVAAVEHLQQTAFEQETDRGRDHCDGHQHCDEADAR